MRRVDGGVVTREAGVSPDGMILPYRVNVSGLEWRLPVIVYLDGAYWPWGERAALAALAVADDFGTGTVRAGSSWFRFCGGVLQDKGV